MTDVTITKDVVYDTQHDLKTDLYTTDAVTASSPAIIIIHGGGWFRGDKSKEADLGEILAEYGYFTVVPNYRLAPKDLFPASRDDLETLYTWVKNSDYSFDHSQIAAVGASAGGNLAGELALKFGIPAVSWSGIFDLYDWVSKHPDVVAEPDTKQDATVLASAQIDQDGAHDAFYKWFVLNYVNGDMAQLKEADPIQRVTAQSGPIYFANSLNELVPISGVEKMQAALSAAGVATIAQFIPGSRHGKAYQDDVLANTLDFFKKNLQ
ncbi:alpha/beta hydrolase [Schleiferilactobacillus shenzhenensis]|uniref:Arylacetamide deacetylase n=1 Tax=Schleiferilactobacillus shenzhenensis LY-73 TaxID=1231336 RepID=U4TTT5_9LACO|nr:alpha/beta hydrolase [Schleiferilactobacillus shenzhenensis]ERL64837.1 arylacetamide deacetylase [Schleiferilactobacillus shenzhenensis LY-73]